MKFTLAALLALAASKVSAQAITAVITPPSPAPSGCVASYSGNFEINVMNASTTKRDLSLKKRVTVCGGTGTLVLTLANGQLHDAFGRTGYVASNYQFQFDKPPQAGAIYTAGFSICPNNTIALGGSAVFYQCLSGTFYNLYDQSTGGQCSPAYIDIVPCVVEGAATTTYATTGSASSAASVPATSPISTSTTAVAVNSTLITSTQTSTTATSVVMVSAVTAHTNSTILSTTGALSVLSSTTKAPSTTTAATTVASTSPISTAGAAMFSYGKEVAAIAVGVVAFAMI